MNKTAIAIAASIIGILSVSGAAFAMGFNGFPAGYANMTAVQQAIQTNDFAAWKNAMMSTLTQDNFDKMTQHYNATLQMKQIRSEITSAVASGNYTAYQEVVGKMSSYMMSQDKFNALVARYNTTNEIPTMGWGMMHRARWR